MTPALTLAWWLTPLSGASEHHLPDWVIWHARTMVAAWAVLLPLGVLVARYFKVTPRQDWPRVLDNRAWWHAHRGLQYGGMALVAVGTWLAWNQGAQASASAVWHHWLGWAVVILGAGQLISAWTRGSKGGPTEPTLRGDHYDMTPHRRWFERLHKGLGWLAIGAAVLTVVARSRRRRCTALDGGRAHRLVVAPGRLRLAMAAPGPLHRHLPSHLGA